ncbi:peptide-methionine (S)-S-oxide reductase MsrA [Candidatus Parcubacteria bacterium]|nr:peptide-methionine (S)-S-oxide reductase MsrA [Candidatus Parcubacteria bacterium]
METIIFGGGCFWCTEAVFGILSGIVSVKSGYAGGETANPTYEQVSSGKTGHAEVLKIEYNPAQISLHDLLTVFFASHDPTTRNRQGADVGTQYRSIILYTTPEQKSEAEKYISEINSPEHPIVTEVMLLKEFYPAEEYHQNFYKNHEEEMYSQAVIKPKLEKVEKEFQQLLKKNL